MLSSCRDSSDWLWPAMPRQHSTGHHRVSEPRYSDFAVGVSSVSSDSTWSSASTLPINAERAACAESPGLRSAAAPSASATADSSASNPVQNAIATTFPGPDAVIQFGIADVDFDELSFFSDADDGFVIPAGEGIERVDVSANLTCSITTSDETTGGYDLTIQKNGVGLAQASMPFKLQGLSSAYVSLDDEPVVAGDVFRLALRVTGTGTNVVITDNSKFNIKVSKFAS